ncbi:MAG: DUF4442 domain-containing protein [Nitrospirae bacterium]|nr:DUF4442 domain-containing protein [Nitrospirota bacterium]
MTESFRTRLMRWGFNLFPAYRRTGGRITRISSDLMRVQIKIPLNWKTRNYVGTLFGGSMYGAVDPIYMVMLIHLLGPEYNVWDKAATITFRKPGRGTLYAEFVLSREELQGIRDELAHNESIHLVYTVDLTDIEGTVHATVEKTLYLRRRAK